MAQGCISGLDRDRSYWTGAIRVVDGNRCDSGYSGVRDIQPVGNGNNRRGRYLVLLGLRVMSGKNLNVIYRFRLYRENYRFRLYHC